MPVKTKKFIRCYCGTHSSHYVRVCPACWRNAVELLTKARQIGCLMSNVCYNLGQGQPVHDIKTLDDLRRQWDALAENSYWTMLKNGEQA